MYELLCGRHPIWEIEKDNREKYREKLKKAPRFNFDSNFSALSISFFKHMCDFRPSNRYTVETALLHPWITRDEKARIPLNPLEENLFLYDVD
jgi:serine/threonine protein kinase